MFEAALLIDFQANYVDGCMSLNAMSCVSSWWHWFSGNTGVSQHGWLRINAIFCGLQINIYCDSCDKFTISSQYDDCLKPIEFMWHLIKKHQWQHKKIISCIISHSTNSIGISSILEDMLQHITFKAYSIYDPIIGGSSAIDWSPYCSAVFWSLV